MLTENSGFAPEVNIFVLGKKNVGVQVLPEPSRSIEGGLELHLIVRRGLNYRSWCVEAKQAEKAPGDLDFVL